jgi:hypothetical protein
MEQQSRNGKGTSIMRLPPLATFGSHVYDVAVMEKSIVYALSFAALALGACLGCKLQAQPRPAPNAQLASIEVNQRVESLLKQMTLEENRLQPELRRIGGQGTGGFDAQPDGRA